MQIIPITTDISEPKVCRRNNVYLYSAVNFVLITVLLQPNSQKCCDLMAFDTVIAVQLGTGEIGILLHSNYQIFPTKLCLPIVSPSVLLWHVCHKSMQQNSFNPTLDGTDWVLDYHTVGMLIKFLTGNFLLFKTPKNVHLPVIFIPSQRLGFFNDHRPSHGLCHNTLV